LADSWESEEGEGRVVAACRQVRNIRREVIILPCFEEGDE